MTTGLCSRSIGLILALTIVSAAGCNRRPASGIHSNREYFYDLSAGAVFAVPAGSVSPMPAPSGGEGVRAVIVGCGGCEPAKLKPVRLEKYDEQAAAAAKDKSLDPRQRADAMTRGLLIAAPGSGSSIQWHSDASPEGRKILSADIRTVCGETSGQFCSP